MSNKPITMNRIRLIIQSLNQGDSIMEISRKYGISRNTIKKYRKIINEGGNTYSSISDIGDEQLSNQIQPRGQVQKNKRYDRLNSRQAEYLKLLTNKHVTKQLLWEQYREEEGEQGYSNSQFI